MSLNFCHHNRTRGLSRAYPFTSHLSILYIYISKETQSRLRPTSMGKNTIHINIVYKWKWEMDGDSQRQTTSVATCSTIASDYPFLFGLFMISWWFLFHHTTLFISIKTAGDFSITRSCFWRRSSRR